MRILEVTANSEHFAAALQLRKQVFIDEQHVPADLEHDGLDAEALHLLAIEDLTDRPVVVGTARLIRRADAVKIGRVAVMQTLRGTGVGRQLMAAALACVVRMGYQRAELSAQAPVVGFYARLGFVVDSAEYLEAGIPHRHMTWHAGSAAPEGEP